MSDLISRQAAIDALELTTWYHQNRNGEMVEGANSQEDQAWYKAEDVHKVLNDLPSAQPDFDTDQKINKAYDDGYDQGYLQCKMDQEGNKMEKANATLGTRISDLLERQGLSQRELADKVGVTEVSMYRYIKGERTPKGPIIANIAKVLHTTPDFLLGFETEEADINDAAGD